jgi:hypothetical protein
MSAIFKGYGSEYVVKDNLKFKFTIETSDEQFATNLLFELMNKPAVGKYEIDGEIVPEMDTIYTYHQTDDEEKTTNI